MSDFTPRPDDEIVSAHLDGEATTDEAARVQGDPAAQARFAAFDAVRAEVARPVHIDTVAREQAIAAALDVFDREVVPRTDGDRAPAAAPGMPTTEAATPWLTTTTAEPAAPAPVTDLAARRERRSLRSLQLLSAAAAIVLIVGVLAAVRIGQRSNDTTLSNLAGAPAAAPTTATQQKRSADAQANSELSTSGQLPGVETPSTTSATASSTTPSTPSPTVAPNVATGNPTTAPSPIVGGSQAVAFADLGAVATSDELLHALAAQLSKMGADAAGPATTTSTPTAPDLAAAIQSCDRALRATDFEIGTFTFAATVTYAGTPGFALLYSIDQQQHPDANGPARVYVVSRSCAVLDVRTL